MQVASTLGVAIASHKTEGPTTSLVYLGIEVDTVAGELRLPQDKLQRIRAHLSQWGDRKVCTQRELESLIGLLNHACKVVCCFLRHMIDLLHARAGATHFIAAVPILLNMGFRADLAWWQCFIEEWNGTSFLHPSDLPSLINSGEGASPHSHWVRHMGG